MSQLTREKMDKINFLLTEVSLECLGNKFFDIYGNQNKTLLGLISVNTLKQVPTSANDDSDLWTALTTEKKPIIQNRNRVVVESEVKLVQPKRKRRASTTGHNEPATSNDPEELLVPMATAPKAAKISQRRSTICVQPPKIRKQPIIVPANHARKPGPHTSNGPKKLRPSMAIPFRPAKITQNRQINLVTARLPKETIDDYLRKRTDDANTDIKQNLKRDINIRNNAMRLLSESQEEKYRTLNINANMDDFYKAEEKRLFSQCNTLIQFIKFIQEDGNNASQLTHISQAILALQKEY